MSNLKNDLLVACDEVNELINKMPLSLAMNVFEVSTEMPAVAVMRDEFMIKLVCRKALLSDQEVCTSINKVNEIAVALKKYKLSWLDRLSVNCRSYVQSYSLSKDLCLSVNSGKMKLCAWLYHLHNERIGSISSVEENRVKLLSILLHESGANVRRLIVKNRCLSWCLQKKRQLYYSGFYDIAQSSHQWSQRASYEHYIKTNQRSRVLVSIHMGDFIGALREVSKVSNDNRKVISLRQGEELDEIKAVVARKERHHVIERATASPLKIVSSLRKGNVTLVAFTDLNRSFGEVAEIKFMGVNMEFVKGPVTMAVLGNADIVPVVSYQKKGHDYMEMGPILTPNPDDSFALNTVLVRYMQILFDWFEYFIRSYPEQWKYLPECNSYLSSNT